LKPVARSLSLVIHPSLVQASAAAEKELSEKNVVLHSRHLTFSDLISNIRNRSPEHKPAPGKGGWRWLVLNACREESQRLGLDFSAELLQGYVASISNFFLNVDLLKKPDQAIWPEGHKGSWLKAVHNNLRGKLEESGFASDGDVLREFLRLNTSDISLPLLEPFESMELRHFRMLHPLHLELVLMLSKILPVKFSVRLDPENASSESLPSMKLVRLIERQASDADIEIEFEAGRFSRGDICADRVQLWDCDERRSEIRYCGDRVKELLKSGVQPGKIALIVPDIESYRSFIREEIRERGLPYAYHRAASLREAPALRWCHWLRMALDKQPRVDTLMELVRELSSVFPAWSEWQKETIDAACAELYSAGVFTWCGQAVAEKIPQGEGHELVERLSIMVKDFLSQWQGKSSFKEHLERMSELLDECRMCFPSSNDDKRHFALNWHVLQTAINITEEWSGLAGAAESSVSGSLFLTNWISEIDRSISLRSSPEPEVVAVLDPEEAAFLDLDYVFWLGMTDGEFPKLAQGGLLNDKEAAALNRLAGMDLWPRPNSLWSAAREDFEQIINNAGRIVLSCYRVSESDEEKTPSPVYLEIRDLLYSEEDSGPYGVSASDLEENRRELVAGLSSHYKSCGFLEEKERDYLGRVFLKCAIESERLSFFANVGEASEMLMGPYCGLLGACQYSASQTERQTPLLSQSWFKDYARCPFRFLLERGLKLVRPPEEEYELSPLLVGEVVHDVMNKWLKGRKRDWTSLPDEEDLDEMRVLVAEQLEQASLRSEHGNRDIAGLRAERWSESICDYILSQVLGDDFETLESELAFGIKASKGATKSISDSFELEGTLGARMALNGRIDRLDRLSDRTMRILDYKTGNASGLSGELKVNNWGVSSFQVPIYLMAAKDAAASGRLDADDFVFEYAALKNDKKKRIAPKSGFASVDLDDLRQDFADKLEMLYLRALSGDFRIEPESCAGCKYSSVCRIVRKKGMEKR